MEHDKKGSWEKIKIIEIWEDGRKFWSMIRELIGRDRMREEEVYIFVENGSKHEILTKKVEFTVRWVEDIYQKAKKKQIFPFGMEKMEL